MASQPTDIATATRCNSLAHELAHNAYITDGQNLFRCLESCDGEEVMLEDCLSLELILCQVEDLVQADAQLVKPGRPLLEDTERPLVLAAHR